MLARFTNFNSSLTFEIDGDGPKKIFRELAAIQEVFDSERRCGVCQSEGIRYQFRQVDKFDFFELVCRAPGCRARFAFGQAKEGGALFPKRKDEDGNWIPNGGWVKYVKPGSESSESAPAGSAPGTNHRGDTATQEADMQDVYDRLGARFGVHAPVSFQAALALMHGRLEPIGALPEYNRIHAAAAAANPRGITDPGIKKKILTDMWNAYLTAKAADDVPF